MIRWCIDLILYAGLVLWLLIGYACAQLTGTTFPTFITSAPLATTPTGPVDFIPVIQGGVTKKLPAQVGTLGGGSNAFTQLQIAIGIANGLYIGGLQALTEDSGGNFYIGNANFVTNQARGFWQFQSALTVSGALTLSGALAANAGLTMPANQTLKAGGDIALSDDGAGNLSLGTATTIRSVTIGNFAVPVTFGGPVNIATLPNGGGGQCIGYNQFTHQLYLALARC